jgi:hypothetical protein
MKCTDDSILQNSELISVANSSITLYIEFSMISGFNTILVNLTAIPSFIKLIDSALPNSTCI